jgi:hypothetical protein
MDTITFIKLPVSVCDSKNEHFLFYILLPSTCDEQVNLFIINFLSKLRSVFANQKQIDSILSSFLDSLPYITFNHIYILSQDDEMNRLSDGLQKIKIGTKVFSLNNQEHSDFYFNNMVCMYIMNFYMK